MSLVGKPGYKETAIGWIPNDWNSEQLGRFITLLTGAPFKSELFSSDEGIPLIRIRDLLRGFSETGYVGEYDDRYLVEAGDVLVGMDGDFHVVRWKGSRALLNQRVLKISAKPGLSDEGFLFFLVASAIGKIQDGISATTVKHLSTKDLQNLTAAIPPLPEQQKIAAILTAVDDKLDIIARQIESTQTLKRGLMQTLFSRGVGTQDTNGRWVPHTEFKDSELGKIPGGWDVVQIQAIAEVIRGASPRPQGDPRYYGGDVPRLMGADVTRDGKWVTPRIDFLTQEGAKRSRPCTKGTLTIICSGDVGIPSFLAVDACIHDGFLALINVDELKANKNYLYHVIYSLKQKLDASATHGGVFTNLTTGILKEFRLPLPPTNEQEKIALTLDIMDEKLAIAAKKRADYQTLKQGLMQKLLTGEWRVKLDKEAVAA